MKVAMLLMTVSAAFASLSPFHLPKNPAEISQGANSGKALNKAANTSATMVTGAHDPDLIGLWVADSTIGINDTTADSGFVSSINDRAEIYLAVDGSMDSRIRGILNEGDTLVDTVEIYTQGTWATANGWIYMESSSSVVWSSLSQIAVDNPSTGIDSLQYLFSNVGKTIAEIFTDSSSSTIYTKSGTAANFTLPVLVATPILAQHAVGIKSHFDGTRFGFVRYKNRAYRISGARTNIPE